MSEPVLVRKHLLDAGKGVYGPVNAIVELVGVQDGKVLGGPGRAALYVGPLALTSPSGTAGAHTLLTFKC